MYKLDRVNNLLHIFSFATLGLYTYLIFNIHQIGYETTYYTNIPFWYSILPTISFLFYTYLIIVKRASNTYTLILYISLISVLIPLLWYIKYGTFYGFGDIYVHFDIVTGILKNGHYSSKLIYPLLHTYLSIFSLITSNNIHLTFLGFHFVLFPLYILIIYLICKIFSFNNLEIYISLAFCVLNPFVIIDLSVIVPYVYSEVILLFALYTMMKAQNENSTDWHIILIIIGISLVYSHFISAFTLIGIYITYYLINTAIKKDIVKLGYSFHKNFGNYIILLIVFLLFWLYIVNTSAEHLINAMLQTFSTALFEKDLSVYQTSITTRTPIDFLIRRINIISQVFLILMSCIYIYTRKNKMYKEQIITYLSLYFLVNLLFYIVTTRFITQAFGISGRFVYYATLLFPPYIGYLLNGIVTSNVNRRNIRCYLIIFFIAGLFFMSLMTQYPRSEYGYYNPYTTDNSISGLEWGYNHIDWNGSKIMGGGDHFESLSLDLIGNETYPTMKGSTNGLIEFLGEDPSNYETRGVHDKYISDGKKEYIYYEPLMSYFVANSLYTDKIFTVNDIILSNKTSLQKIYTNRDFTAYYKVK